MKIFHKLTMLTLATLVGLSGAMAKPVSQNTAKQAALNFLANEASYVPSQPLTLVKSNSGIYIFSNDNCFVIISADRS